MARHQDALALGEKVSHQVGDGVGLARARRTLHQDRVILLDAVGDLQLFFVGLFGQQHVHALAAHGCQLLFNGPLAAILRQVDLAPADQVGDGRGHDPGLLDVLNDLLDGLGGAVQPLADDVAWLQIQQQAVFPAPPLWNARRGEHTVGGELTHQRLQKVRCADPVQGMIVVCAQVVIQAVDGVQIDAIHHLKQHGVKLGGALCVVDGNDVFHGVIRQLHPMGQHGMRHAGGLHVPQDAVGHDDLLGLRLPL